MDPKNVSTEPIEFASMFELTPEKFQKQEADYVYRYRYNGGAASQVWLSHGRFCFRKLTSVVQGAMLIITLVFLRLFSVF